MKYFKFLLIGIIFGITLSKAEVISWYRIFEMFRFQSFHMYGIIGSSVLLGIPIMYCFRKQKLKNYNGKIVIIEPKEKGVYRNLLGGVIFGLGWALSGLCPAPMFILIGKGVFSVLIIILGALLGTVLYHAIKKRLPH